MIESKLYQIPFPNFMNSYVSIEQIKWLQRPPNLFRDCIDYFEKPQSFPVFASFVEFHQTMIQTTQEFWQCGAPCWKLHIQSITTRLTRRCANPLGVGLLLSNIPATMLPSSHITKNNNNNKNLAECNTKCMNLPNQIRYFTLQHNTTFVNKINSRCLPNGLKLATLVFSYY